MTQQSSKSSNAFRSRTTRHEMQSSRSGDKLAADSALAPNRVKASRVMVNGKVEAVTTASSRPRVALNDKSNNKASKQSQEQNEAGYSKPGAHSRTTSQNQANGLTSSSSTSTIRPAMGARGKVRSSTTIETGANRSVAQKTTSHTIGGARSRSNSSSTGLTSSQPLPRSISSRTLARTSSHPTVSLQEEPIQEAHLHSSQQVSGRSANLGRSSKQSNSMDLDGDEEEMEDDAELEELENAIDTDDGSDGELDEEMDDGDSDVSVDGRKEDGGSITSAEEQFSSSAPDQQVLRPEDHQQIDEALSDVESDTDSNFSLVLDPEGIVSLSPEMEAAAQAKVAAICARYNAQVLEPAAQQAAIERAEAVARGEIPKDNAAHDDELAQMGLDPEEVRDTSMVAEYSKEIFGYMDKCEKETMANPNYMEFQNEIQWHMRATLVDWLLQVHMRYHMLPETLWIGVNIVDRFLSVRVVSLAKLQLVGVTAMFIAAKYEEILAPSVEEFVYMTEGGYSREEILKGERIILATLNFNVSTYCSPYSWVRRISKADDYDIQTRTLSKFLMEVTLLDHRFLRARPSLIAAVGMFLAKKMLSGEWDDAFVYYSAFTEEQLVPGANLLLEKLIDPAFEDQFVCRKYANKKFLKASTFARDWAQRHHSKLMESANNSSGEIA